LAAGGNHFVTVAVAYAALNLSVALQQHGVVPLVRLLLTSSDRWEQRDAAFALMALQLDTQQLQAAAADVITSAAAATAQQQVKGAAVSATAAEAQGDSSEHVAASSTEAAVAPTQYSSTVSSASSTSSSSSLVLSERSNTTAAAIAAAAPGIAATQPLAELLATGLEHVHELLGRYRWCSQQYLQGQVCMCASM
jgi:hypothetical protein